MPGSKRRRWWIVGGLLLAGAAIWLIWGGSFLAWYNVRQLAQADEASRETWLVRVLDRAEASWPHLVSRWQTGEGPAALEVAMHRLLERWQEQPDKTQRMARDLAAQFPSYPTAAKKSCLKVLAAILRAHQGETLPDQVSQQVGDVVAGAAREKDLRQETLILASALLDRATPGPALTLARDLAAQGLEDERPAIRVAAIQLLLRPALKKDSGLLPKVVPLLRDDQALVRRAAVIALASAEDLVNEDDLLPLLHDPDPQVQSACELALRSRGLQESHLPIARAISDPRPSARLEVLQHLRLAVDLEPGVWLRRLTQDGAPAVRAAAIRAAASQTHADLRDRLREMTTSDPSPTVRQLAEHYLQQAPPPR